jgi:16S rRNA processing protein RimM
VTGADPRLLAAGRVLLVDGRPTRIERRAGTDERPILRLAGHAGRDAAEALRGTVLQARLEDAPALEEDEYWAHELEGCVVRDGTRELGVVRRLLGLPSCDALEVERPDGPDLLVPLVRDAVRRVDVAGRVVEVDATFLGA